jgi:hypothetical protein
MVAPVQAQISKLRTRLPAAARRRSSPLLTTHDALHTVFLSPLCFHTPLPRSARGTNPFSRNSFFFTSIQNPGGVGSRTQSSPRLSLCALCLCGKSIFFKSLRPLCRLFALFSALVSFVFSRLQPLFPKRPGRECLQHLRSELRLRRHMRHVAPLSPAPSLDCVYFPPPWGCTSPLSCFGLLVPTPPPDLE